MSQQLTEQRKAVEASEAALQAFREKKGAVSVTDNASNIVVQRLTDLNSALTKAKTERINKEALYNQLKSAGVERCTRFDPAVLSNDYIQKLRSEVADLQRTQAQLAERYGERHAEMIKVRTALDLADAKLKNGSRRPSNPFATSISRRWPRSAACRAPSIRRRAKRSA